MFFSNVCGVFSFLHWMEKHTNGNVMALAAEDESAQALGLNCSYQFDTSVVSRGINADRNRTLTQRIVLSPVSAVYNLNGLVAFCTVKAWIALKHN